MNYALKLFFFGHSGDSQSVSQSLYLQQRDRRTERDTRHPSSRPRSVKTAADATVKDFHFISRFKEFGQHDRKNSCTAKSWQDQYLIISSAPSIVVVVVAIRKTYHPPTQRTSHLSVQLKGFCCIVSGLLQPPSIPQPPLTTLLAESLLLVAQLPPRVSLHPPPHHHHHHKAIMHVPFLRSEEATLSYNYIVNYVIYSEWSLI